MLKIHLQTCFFLQFWGSCWGYAGVLHNVSPHDLRPAKTFRMKWKTCSHSDGSWSRGDVSDRFECWRVQGPMQRNWTTTDNEAWLMCVNLITEGPSLFVRGSATCCPFRSSICWSKCVCHFVRVSLGSNSPKKRTCCKQPWKQRPDSTRSYPVLGILVVHSTMSSSTMFRLLQRKSKSHPPPQPWETQNWKKCESRWSDAFISQSFHTLPCHLELLGLDSGW